VVGAVHPGDQVQQVLVALVVVVVETELAQVRQELPTAVAVVAVVEGHRIPVLAGLV
jgi:hypothetical protein